MGSIDWQDLFFSFDGRINRGKFWAGIGMMWLLALIVGGIIGFGLFAVSKALGWIVFIVVYAAALWIGLALSVKRWHDRDKSGWWILIGLVPIIGGLWALIETGFLPGTDGNNQYGPDPLGHA
ncbi:MAG: DUF805 domain-containing protein [Actinomycetota bacterium]